MSLWFCVTSSMSCSHSTPSMSTQYELTSWNNFVIDKSTKTVSEISNLTKYRNQRRERWKVRGKECVCDVVSENMWQWQIRLRGARSVPFHLSCFGCGLTRESHFRSSTPHTFTLIVIYIYSFIILALPCSMPPPLLLLTAPPSIRDNLAFLCPWGKVFALGGSGSVMPPGGYLGATRSVCVCVRVSEFIIPDEVLSRLLWPIRTINCPL